MLFLVFLDFFSTNCFGLDNFSANQFSNNQQRMIAKPTRFQESVEIINGLFEKKEKENGRFKKNSGNEDIMALRKAIKAEENKWLQQRKDSGSVSVEKKESNLNDVSENIQKLTSEKQNELPCLVGSKEGNLEFNQNLPMLFKIEMDSPKNRPQYEIKMGDINLEEKRGPVNQDIKANVANGGQIVNCENKLQDEGINIKKELEKLGQENTNFQKELEKQKKKNAQLEDKLKNLKNNSCCSRFLNCFCCCFLNKTNNASNNGNK